MHEHTRMLIYCLWTKNTLWIFGFRTFSKDSEHLPVYLLQSKNWASTILVDCFLLWCVFQKAASDRGGKLERVQSGGRTSGGNETKARLEEEKQSGLGWWRRKKVSAEVQKQVQMIWFTRPDSLLTSSKCLTQQQYILLLRSAYVEDSRLYTTIYIRFTNW